MISSSWNQLQISQAELETVLELNIIDEWTIAWSNTFYLKHSKADKTLLLITSTFIFVSLLVLFPLNLMIFRQLGLVANSNLGLRLILLVTGCMSILLLTAFYYYLDRQAKKLRLLAILLKKVEQYNRAIDSYNLLANINAIANNPAIENRATLELKSVLDLTKNSLLQSLKLENLIYHHQNFTTSSDYPNPMQLLAHLEDSLANLPSDGTEQNTEYQQMLDEAVSLGLSVRQEISKIWHLRQED